MLINKNKNKINHKSGFSLLELSIIISTAAALTVGFLNWQSPSTATNSQKYIETQKKIETINTAIEAFRISKKRLPCPADPFMRPDNSRNSDAPIDYFVNPFGVEDLDTNNDIVNSEQTIGMDCPNNIGSLPVFSLNLGKEYIMDAWGNRFTYHVSNSLCGSENTSNNNNSIVNRAYNSLIGCTEYSYKNNNGNINIKNKNNDILVNNAAYVILSHGANGLGSTLISSSKAKMPISAEEIENSNSDDEYIITEQSKNFDDVLLFKTRQQIEKDIKSRDENFLSVEACNDNSDVIRELTNSELVDLDDGLSGYEYHLSTSSDQSVLRILNTIQASCIETYGVYANNENGWIGAQCVGNRDISINGSTFDPKTGTCKCANGKWDGSCTMLPKFIVVGDNGSILSSSDSKKWIIQNTGTSNNLKDIIHNGQKYIVVGGTNNSYILSSDDGITWNKENLFTEAPANSIANNNEIYIIAGELNSGSPPPLLMTNYTNFDTQWSKQDTGTSSAIQSIMFANGLFLAGTKDGKIITSPKGVTWNTNNVSSGSINKILFNNEYYIAVADYGKIYKAPPTITSWKEYNATSEDIHDIAFGNGIFVAVANNSKVVISNDADDWVEKDLSSTIGFVNLYSVTFDHNKFIAVGNNSIIISSYDGSSWTKEDVPYSNYQFNKIISVE